MIHLQNLPHSHNDPDAIRFHRCAAHIKILPRIVKRSAIARGGARAQPARRAGRSILANRRETDFAKGLRILAEGPNRCKFMAAAAGQYQGRLSVLAAFICEFDGPVNGFALIAKCALQVAGLYDPLLAPLQHNELDELGHLVKSAKQPNQKDDRNRDPDQPQQKTAAHGVLLFTLLSTLLHRLNALPVAKFPRLDMS